MAHYLHAFIKASREPGNEHDGCLATIETMKETFVIVQTIPHEEIRDSVCQNEACVKRVGKALIPICSGQPWQSNSVSTQYEVWIRYLSYGRDQHEVLPRLRMGKPTVDVIKTALTERKL